MGLNSDGGFSISSRQGLSGGMNISPERAAMQRPKTPGAESSDKTNSLKNNILAQSADELMKQEHELGAMHEIKVLHALAESPSLLLPNFSENLQTLRQLLDKLLEDFQLPRSPTLINQLTKETVEKVLFKIQNQATETDVSTAFLHNEMKGFFDLLTKLYPLALGIASNMLGEEQQLTQDLAGQTLGMMNDLALLAQEMLQKSLLPPGQKAQQLALLKELQNLLQNREGCELDRIGPLLSQISTAGQGVSQQLSVLFAFLQQLKNISSQEQLLSLQSALTAQAESSSGAVGQNISDLSEGMANLTAQLLEKMTGGPELDSRNHLYAQAFKQAMLIGALIGASVASAEAQEHNTQLAAHIASTKIHSIKELGIIDLIPFSLLAFFPDLRDPPRGDSDVIKMAKNALMQLIRVLLQLVFLLSAIASAGNTLGKEGMETLIEEQMNLILHLLDTLVFALKKVDEHYGISVSFHIASVRQAKNALINKDYSQFWSSILHMFTTKTELSGFLQDIEDAQPLFQTLKSMLQEPNQTFQASI